MPGVGVGGLVSNLINPGLDKTIADQITPNPNPLAQQGQGGQTAPAQGSGAPPQSNLASAAVTQPDPVSANLGSLLLKPSLAENLAKEQRQADLAADFNRNIAGVAAGFGTAQQQQSKQAALAGMPGATDQVGMWQKIQEAQQTQTDQNEHARFMGNMRVLAKVLGYPDTPEGIAAATEVANNKGLLEQQGQVAASNATQTEATKNVNELVKSYIAANPNATTQDIQNYRAQALANMMPNTLDPLEKNMRQDSMRWDQENKDKAGAVKPPWLTDLTQYRAHQDVVANAQKDLTQEKNQFDTTDSKFAALEDNIAWLQAHPKEAAAAVLDANWRTDPAGVAGSYPKLTNENSDTIEARKRINQMASQFMGEAIKGLGRISYAEASKLGGAMTNLTQRGGSPQDVMNEIERLRQQAVRGRANVQAAAGKTLDADHSGFADPQYFDPNDPFYSHATVSKGAPTPGTLGTGASSSGVERPLQSLDSDGSARVKAALAAHPDRRDEILKTVRKNGFDPGSL